MKFIRTIGTFMNNCGFWFILSGIPSDNLGVINIYALNDPLYRCILWETLLRELPRHRKWIVMGDFNMVEARIDKSFQCSRMISGHEKMLFNALKDAFMIQEPTREVNGLSYTWDNLRFNGVRILAKLDRCYSFTLDARRLVIRCRINRDATNFNHNPILVSVQLGSELPRPSRWKMSTRYLREMKSRL